MAESDTTTQAVAPETEKIFRRLHQKNVVLDDVFSDLEAKKQLLKPEDIINHALKLDSEHAIQLLKLLQKTSEQPDLSKISFQPDKIKNPVFKLILLGYFGSLNQPKIPLLVTRFLPDPNRVVVLEALKSLLRLTMHFDVSIILPHIESMSAIEQEMAIEIIKKQADAGLVPHLTDYLSGKPNKLNESLSELVALYTDKANFEKFLLRLSLEDEWIQQEVMARVQKHCNENLSDAARELTGHDKEFVRNSAQQLVINLLDDKDIAKIEEFALNDNWKVRQRGIQSLGKSSNRAAIPILKKILDSWPEDAVLVLRAVKQLGLAKGLEIGFNCLKSSEANTQRAALETIETLTTKKHASSIRDNILWSIPRLSDELKSFAKQMIIQITHTFELPDIQIDRDTSTISTIAVPEQKARDFAKPQKQKPSALDKLTAGTKWMDRYHIKKEIGRGAMGRVMLVEDEMVDEALVLKFMLPELTIDDDSTERFKREVKYSRRVGHKNVIRVHDLLIKDDLCAISMEYFKSRGLEVIQHEVQAFATRDGLKILYQVASGMAAAHEQAVIHRDLKPSNVLIDDKGKVKIVDFGIASAGASAESILTQQGAIIGSPAYLAPERADGRDSDARSDIYSLGIVAYYMFSGKLPYSGKPLEVLAQHREGNAPPITRVNASASAEVSNLIVKLMAVDPDARPQTMVAVRDEIKALLGSN